MKKYKTTSIYFLYIYIMYNTTSRCSIIYFYILNKGNGINLNVFNVLVF